MDCLGFCLDRKRLCHYNRCNGENIYHNYTAPSARLRFLFHCLQQLSVHLAPYRTYKSLGDQVEGHYHQVAMARSPGLRPPLYSFKLYALFYRKPIFSTGNGFICGDFGFREFGTYPADPVRAGKCPDDSGMRWSRVPPPYRTGIMAASVAGANVGIAAHRRFVVSRVWH